MTYEEFLKAKRNRSVWEYFCEAEDDRNSRFHKMAACEKMSRKRLVKLLMAAGKDRNTADNMAKRIHGCGSYMSWWNHQGHEVLNAIRNRENVEAKLLKAIFGEDYKPEISKAKSEVREKRANRLKSEYEALVELQNEFPDCVDVKSCLRARDELIQKYIEPTGEVDENGARVMKPTDFKLFAEALTKLSPLLDFYTYRGQ